MAKIKVEVETPNIPDKTEDELLADELRCILARLVELRINDIGELGRAIDKAEKRIQSH